jgi:hypothetical protein
MRYFFLLLLCCVLAVHVTGWFGLILAGAEVIRGYFDMAHPFRPEVFSVCAMWGGFVVIFTSSGVKQIADAHRQKGKKVVK